jgi:hypothetical protein
MNATGFSRFAPDPRAQAPFTIDDEEYVVVNTDDLAIRGDIIAGGTRGEATDALESYLSANPGDRGKYQVMLRHLAEVA